MELQSPVASVSHHVCKKHLRNSITRQSTELRASVFRQSRHRHEQKVVGQLRLSLPTIITRKPRSQLRCAAQAAASENMKVGFVGVGIMGLAMVGMHFDVYLIAVAFISGYPTCVDWHFPLVEGEYYGKAYTCKQKKLVT